MLHACEEWIIPLLNSCVLTWRFSHFKFRVCDVDNLICSNNTVSQFMTFGCISAVFLRIFYTLYFYGFVSLPYEKVSWSHDSVMTITIIEILNNIADTVQLTLSEEFTLWKCHVYTAGVRSGNQNSEKKLFHRQI